MDLDGRGAIVTGGASGIGRAVALRLARDGATVGVIDLDGEGARDTARAASEHGRPSAAIEADVSSFDTVIEAVAAARREVGPVAILVSAAGIGGRRPFCEMTEAEWDRMIAVHLKGAFNVARAAIDDMVAAGWGRIVNVTSVAALRGGEGLTHYAAAKAGMIGFTKALARDLAGTGVTVNAVACGLIDTPMVRRSGRAEAFLELAARATLVGRVGKPDDIAAACAYLISDEAGFVTGQVLSPNGGAWL